MSGYNPYGHPGHQNPIDEGQHQQPLPGSSRPPVAPSPYHQQSGTSYEQGPPNGQYGGIPYSGHQAPGGAPQEQGYFPQQSHGAGNNGIPAMGGLSSQMGNMGLGDESAAATRPHKKKNRHAYHKYELLIAYRTLGWNTDAVS